MKRHVLMAACAALLMGASTAGAAQKIVIATEGAYAPFNFVAADGSLQGFDVDIAKALCAKMQAECEIVQQDWDGMIPALQAKKFDAIVASMAITEERKQKIAFTDKYYNTPVVFAARKGSGVALAADGNPDPASLKGLKLGVQRSTIFEGYARAHFKDTEIVVYDTGDNANLDLMNGRLDLRFDDILALRAGVLEAEGGDEYEIVGKGFTDGELAAGIGIGIRKEDTALIEAFNAAIKAIREDGTYKSINDRYFDFDAYGQ